MTIQWGSLLSIICISFFYCRSLQFVFKKDENKNANYFVLFILLCPFVCISELFIGPMASFVSLIAVSCVYMYYKKYRVVTVLRYIFAFSIILLIVSLLFAMLLYFGIRLYGFEAEGKNDFVTSLFLAVFTELFIRLSDKFGYTMDHRSLKSELKTFLVYFVSFVLLVILTYIPYNRVSGDRVAFNFAFNLLTIILFVTTAILLSKIRENQFKLKLAENEKSTNEAYYLEIEKLNTDLSHFKHDFINIYSTLKNYIEEERYEELRSYFSQNITPINEELIIRINRLKQVSNVNNITLKSFVTNAMIKATINELKLILSVDNELPENIEVNEYRLTRILGIFIDNAIEAALRTEERYVKVEIYINDFNEFIIKISNSIENFDNFTNFFETKKPNHKSQGLIIAKQLISEENKLTHSFYVNDEKNKFIQEIRFLCRTPALSGLSARKTDSI